MMEKQAFDEAVEKYYHLKKQKEALDAQLKELEPSLKEFTKEAGGRVEAGPFVATITVRKNTRTPDVDKMKANGIFEEYSKEKAGGEVFSIKEK